MKKTKKLNLSTLGAQILLKQPESFAVLGRYTVCSNIWIKMYLGQKKTSIQMNIKGVNGRKCRLLDLPRKRDSLQIHLQ